MVEGNKAQTEDSGAAEIVLDEVLKAKEDSGRQRLISSLNKDPWNSELLERFYRKNSENYARIVLRDLIISNPTGEFGIREGVRTRFRRYQNGSISNLESLTLSFSRMFSDIHDDLNEEVIGYITSEIESCYRINPLHAKDLAISAIRSISPISEDKAIIFFRKIKNSLIGSRMMRSAYNLSKRTGRFLLSLSLVDSLEHPDIVENERFIILNSISNLIFDENRGELQRMLEDEFPDDDLQSGLENLILQVSNFSEFFKDFYHSISEDQVSESSDFDIFHEILVLRKYYDEGRLFNYEVPEFGHPFEDLGKIPFFAIEKRIEKWVEESGKDAVIDNLEVITSRRELHPIRTKFILQCSARVFSQIDPEVALVIIGISKRSGFEDEGFLRIGAKSKERLGEIEGALEILESCKQPSSLKLKERLCELKAVLEDGLNIDALGDLSDGYEKNESAILYNVHSSLPYQISGYTIRTSQVVKNLKGMGFEVCVNSRWGFPTDRYDFTGSKEIEKERVVEGITHFFSPDPVGIRGKKFGGYSIEAAKRIVESAKKTRAGIIHSASDYSIGLSSAMAARALNLPFIYEMRGLWAISKLANEPNFELTTEFKVSMRLERQCASVADTVLVISEKLKQLVMEWGVEEDKIIVIPNGADLSSEQGPDISRITSQTLRLGYVGSVVDYEGIEILIDAARIVEGRNPGSVSIDVFGDGKAKDGLEKRANAENPIEVRFHGKIPPEDIDDAYSKLDVVVIPRKSTRITEMVPALKPIEAMSKSKLVLCSDIGPHREIIVNGENGLMFENGSQESLAENILEIISDREKSIQIGNNAKEWVLRNRSWEMVLEPVRKEYLRYEIVRMVDSGLPKTKEIIEKISDLNGGGFSLEEFENNFLRIEKICSSERERKNLFLASLRFIGNRSSDSGVEFGKKYVQNFGDRRSIRSLVTYLSRTGDSSSIMEIISGFEKILDPEWVSDISSIHLEDTSDYEHIDYRREYYDSSGFGFEKDRSDILIYADSTLNLIDGSSIWIQALALCLSEQKRNVVVLCKDNLSNELLSGPLIDNSRIKVVQPIDFGRESIIGTEMAAEFMDIIDSSHGGFSSIICRGLDLALEVRKRPSLMGRVQFYLSDYYKIENNIRIIKEEFSNNIHDLDRFALGFLCQTAQMANEFANKFGISMDRTFILPPIVPSEMVFEKRIRDNGEEIVKIGYSGKFDQSWGIYEMIETCEELIARGMKIELHVIGGKFNRGPNGKSSFVGEIRGLFERKEWIIWHGPKSRLEAAEIMSDVDIAWCFRPASLEENTLEISTKILEAVNMKLPVIAFPNSVNKGLLGDLSPFLTRDIEGCVEAVSAIVDKYENFSSMVDDVNLEKFKSVEIGRGLVNFLPNKEKGRNIILSGHDLKFIYEFESFLKSEGNLVIRDYWEWGGPKDISFSESIINDAEAIISEWGLSSAAWYSKNKKEHQKHIIRLHSQEVRERAISITETIDLQGCDEVVFVSEHIRSAAEDQFGWSGVKLKTIPNYVDVLRFNQEKDFSSEKRIGMVGIVPQSKRLDLALELIKTLNHEDEGWELVIKGKTHRDLPFMRGQSRKKEYAWFEQQFERLQNDEELRETVKFEGHSNPISDWYPKVEFVVSLSDWESFHYTIAEGVSSGCFPLILNWEGSSEIYDPRWVFDDIDEIAKEVIRISKMVPEERSERKKGNRSLILERYDVKNIFDKMSKLLN